MVAHSGQRWMRSGGSARSNQNRYQKNNIRSGAMTWTGLTPLGPNNTSPARGSLCGGTPSPGTGKAVSDCCSAFQQRHYGMKLMAYTLINLRAFCGI